MIFTQTVSYFDKQCGGEVTAEVDFIVDEHRLGQTLGKAAMQNKTGRARVTK